MVEGTLVGFHHLPGVLKFLYHQGVSHGYVSLTMLGLIDGIGLPVPSELTVVALTTLVTNADVALWPAIMIASLGNTAGSLIPYYLAKREETGYLRRFLPRVKEKVDRIEGWVTSYSTLAIVVTRIIGWGRLATIVTAGLLGVRVTVAVPAIFIGGVLWLYFGFLVVHTTGIHIKRIIRSFWGRWWELGIILGIVLIVSVGYLVLRIRRDRKPKGE